MRKTASRAVSAPQSVRRCPAVRQPVFIDVERRGAADPVCKPSVGLGERLARVLHDGVDRAGRKLGAKQLAQKLCGIASRDAVAHREGGDRRLEASSEGSGRHCGGQLGARRGAAVRAAQPPQPMLAELHRSRRQLRDLMAHGLPERLALRRAEDVAAAAARGPVLDELVERRDRQQMTTASRMAWLGAAPAARGSRLPALRRGGRILAGGQRGVAGVAVQASLKLGDALILLGQPLAQLGDLAPERRVLRRELQKHSDDCLASLLIDRLSLGAFHLQGVQGAGVRACLCHLGRLLGTPG